MSDAAVSTRDKAFVWVLYGTGARIAEIMNIKLKNIKFEDTHTEIVIFGKTGGGKVILVYSDAFIRRLVDEHPERDNPEAWLWMNREGKKWSYEASTKFLKRLAKKAGLKKNVHPHLFRHSRETYLAGKIPEHVLKAVMGWVKDSEMASFYVHLNAKRVKEILLRDAYGIEIEKEDKEHVKKCFRCNAYLPPKAKFCPRCGAVVDIKTVYKMKKLKEIEEKIMYNERFEAVRELFKEWLKESKK